MTKYLPQGARLRGRRLQAIRAEHFRLHPLCVACMGRGLVTPATILDHIVSLTNGGADFDRDGGTNRQGLCVACHNAKTAQDRGYKPSTPQVAIGLDGYPL